VIFGLKIKGRCFSILDLILFHSKIKIIIKAQGIWCILIRTHSAFKNFIPSKIIDFKNSNSSRFAAELIFKVYNFAWNEIFKRPEQISIY